MAEIYRIVRVRNNGTEVILRDIQTTDITDEQIKRAEAFVEANARKATGIRVRVYSSDENGVVTPNDMIWDSAVNL